MDATFAIIAGLVGGSIAALLTTLLTISHEREKQLRERMITAADDFTTTPATASASAAAPTDACRCIIAFPTPAAAATNSRISCFASLSCPRGADKRKAPGLVNPGAL